MTAGRVGGDPAGPPDVLAAFGSYHDARADFLARAAAAGARLQAHPHPRWPELSTDVAVLGPPDAPAVLLMVSGTHGIEGHAGSAIQRQFLRERADAGAAAGDAAADDLRIVVVHALNPYGFAHDRRVNEDNIDVNRNFQDFGGASDVPHNVDYRDVHPLLLPADWGGPAHESAQQALLARAAEVGIAQVQSAVTRGQYEFPDGLFFGGTAPSWSNATLRRIAGAELADARQVGYLDLHTGLGARGVGEAIFRGGPDPQALDRALSWYGPGVTSSEAGTSSSTPIGGNSARAVAEELPDGALLTAITLEFGTLDGILVLAALQGDNWFSVHDQRDDPRYAGVREAMFQAFAPDDAQWRAQVLARGAEVIEQAHAGLRAGVRAGATGGAE